MLGNAYVDLFAFSQARHQFRIAQDHARAAESPYWSRSAAAWLASASIAQGDLAEAENILSEALAPDLTMATLAPRLLWRAAAELALARAEPGKALSILDGLVATAPRSANARPVARLEKLRGDALALLGEREAAEIALRRASETAAELGTRPILWRSQLALGRLLQAQHRDEEARRAFVAARGLADELANEIPEPALRDGFLAMAAGLCPPGIDRPTQRTAETIPGGLTPRERDVARLLTEGRSNREIAAALFITEWTAATHVRNILAKLGLTSRTRIATWAVEHGLTAQQAPADRAST
jgi:DNA-binding CsgD family transcriptional regulator